MTVPKKDTISYEDFAKLDIRMGTVLKAEPIEKSEKLLSLTVNLGETYGEKHIMAGVAQWYKPEELIGKQLIFLANLEPRKMMGKESQGMMLAVDTEERPYIIHVEKELADGSSVC